MRAKISIKGQIVIPVELREKYAIAPGDTVDVRDGDGKILIFPLCKDAIGLQPQGLLGMERVRPCEQCHTRASGRIHRGAGVGHSSGGGQRRMGCL